NGDRAAPYYVYLTPVKSEIESAFNLIPTGRGYLAAMSEEHAVSSAMMDKVQRVNSIRIPAPEPEAYKPLIQAFAELPAQGSVTDPTVSEFLAAYQKIDSAIEAL